MGSHEEHPLRAAAVRRCGSAGGLGFSTIELLVGATLSLIALAVLYSVFGMQQRVVAAQNTSAETQAATRNAIDLMSRELRMATYDPTGIALPLSPGPSCPGVRSGLEEAGPTKIRFRQDLDGDGALTSPGEDLTYEVIGNALTRTDGGGPGQTLAAGIPTGGVSFQYFNGNNPPAELLPGGSPAALTPGQRDCVAKVRVTVRVSLPNPDPLNSLPVRSSAASEVAIRNRSLANF
jgi:type IV pilus assembly protein PilW